MSFSENLKKLRIEKSIDQKTLAKELCVSPKTISHWETGYTEPSINQILSLAKILCVSTDKLLNKS